jgi:hypothetical protein
MGAAGHCKGGSSGFSGNCVRSRSRPALTLLVSSIILQVEQFAAWPGVKKGHAMMPSM